MKTPPKFNFRDVSKWRPVDLFVTKKIAHMCCTGVDFQGCSKYETIEGVAKPHGYSSNATKFIALMDEAARVLPPMKREFDRALNEKLQAAAAKLADEQNARVAHSYENDEP